MAPPRNSSGGGCALPFTPLIPALLQAESYGGGLLGGWGSSERFLAACMREGGEAAAAPPGPAPVIVSKYIPLPWRLFEPRCMMRALQATGAGAGGALPPGPMPGL